VIGLDASDSGQDRPVDAVAIAGGHVRAQVVGRDVGHGVGRRRIASAAAASDVEAADDRADRQREQQPAERSE